MGGHVTANPSRIYPAPCLLSPFVSVSSCQISVRSETLNHYLLCRDQTGAAVSRAACQSTSPLRANYRAEAPLILIMLCSPLRMRSSIFSSI